MIPNGERHYNSKLTAADVELIRAATEERRRLLTEARKLSDANLAAKFETSRANIYRISSFQTRRNG